MADYISFPIYHTYQRDSDLHTHQSFVDFRPNTSEVQTVKKKNTCLLDEIHNYKYLDAELI